MPIYKLGDAVPQLPSDGSCWIAPGAHVIGRVKLGRDVGIWFGAVLRGDNEDIAVGDGTNIQDNAVLHADPGFPLNIGPNCTIGHNAIVHGCTVGAGSLIGMGATVLNGANIGAGSVVGAGAVVTENANFPERSLIVGTPARSIRTLPEGDTKLTAIPTHYVANARRFEADLEEIDMPEVSPGKRSS